MYQELQVKNSKASIKLFVVNSSLTKPVSFLTILIACEVRTKRRNARRVNPTNVLEIFQISFRFSKFLEKFRYNLPTIFFDRIEIARFSPKFHKFHRRLTTSTLVMQISINNSATQIYFYPTQTPIQDIKHDRDFPEINPPVNQNHGTVSHFSCSFVCSPSRCSNLDHARLFTRSQFKRRRFLNRRFISKLTKWRRSFEWISRFRRLNERREIRNDLSSLLIRNASTLLMTR